jgi:hypothetical protein
MRFCIFIGLAVKTGTKAEMPWQLRKASLTLASTYPLSYQQKQQGSAYRLEALKCTLQLFINLWKDCGVTHITELLGFRNKSILSGVMNAEHPILNNKVPNPSGLKLIELFVCFNL